METVVESSSFCSDISDRVALFFPHRYTNCREQKSAQIAPTTVPYAAVRRHPPPSTGQSSFL
ncbi:hypothetical protein TIFTF001_027606 [Ficus carica]|uniref:Uncharacterized protein n=1 Tax=Ficus carica TaxID=3494 RepID=A0AA88J0H6_FICCA|nr:hypothetical protein TIFTF001_027606 [Ficus carica]